MPSPDPAAATKPFCPYVGLAPFDRAHWDYYFGRDLDAATLADNVLHAPCTVLYGPSGVGKTSLINVGLPKELRNRGRQARLHVFRRWQEPDARAALLADFGGEGSASLPAALGEIAGRERQPLILILDQFEEYFAYRPFERERRLEAELDEIIRDDALDVSLLVAIREDRYHLLDGLRLAIPDIIENTLELGHLDDKAVRDAILGPLAAYNGSEHRKGRPPIPPPDEQEFVQRLIGQLKEGRAGIGKAGTLAAAERRVELPYLQLALEKIWEGAGGPDLKRLEDGYRRNVADIVEQHLGAVMGKLTPEQHALSARIFDRLVTRTGAKFAMSALDLQDESRGIRKDQVQAILNHLSHHDARILAPVARPGDDQAYEIFHDVLGPPLLRWKERFESAEAERTEKERYRARFRLMAAAGAVLLFLTAAAVGAAIWAIDATARAEQQAIVATSTSIWSRLEIGAGPWLAEHEIDALWELAAKAGTLGAVFVQELEHQPSHVWKLAARPHQIIRALGLRLPPEQAQAALAVVLRAIEGTTEPYALRVLAQAVAALAPSPEQAQAALAAVLRAIEGTTNPYALQTLAPAVAALAPSPEQVQAALAAVLRAIEGTTDPDQLQALGQAMAALAPKLDPEQAQAALAVVLRAIEGTTDPDAFQVLGQAVAALAPKLGSEQAQAALAAVLRAIEGTTNPFVLRVLAQAVAALAPSPEQAQAALAAVLRAIEGTTNPYALRVLAQAVAALAPSPEQVQAALAAVLRAIEGTTDPDQLQALGQAMAALAPKLDPEQAQAALAAVLRAIEGTTDPDALQGLGQAVAALAPKLGPEQAQTVLGTVRSGLAGARTASEAAAWSEAFEALIRPLPARDYLTEIVGVLKYPTAGGEPTYRLLAHLRERFPEVKELAGGDLASALAWIERTYPGIDLDSPPVRPPPLRQAVSAARS